MGNWKETQDAYGMENVPPVNPSMSLSKALDILRTMKPLFEKCDMKEAAEAIDTVYKWVIFMVDTFSGFGE